MVFCWNESGRVRFRPVILHVDLDAKIQLLCKESFAEKYEIVAGVSQVEVPSFAQKIHGNLLGRTSKKALLRDASPNKVWLRPYFLGGGGGIGGVPSASHEEFHIFCGSVKSRWKKSRWMLPMCIKLKKPLRNPPTGRWRSMKHRDIIMKYDIHIYSTFEKEFWGP